MKRRLGRVFILVSLICAWAAGVAAQADPDSADLDSSARIVRLSYVDGQVQMDRGDSGEPDTAFLNTPVIGGARLLTGGDGFAEAEFESGGTVRLTPNSELRFREMGLRDGYKVSLLELVGGTAYFDVKKDANDDFRVLVGSQELRVPKSARFRIRMDAGGAQIAVMKGEVELSGSDQNVRIRKDEQLTLDSQDPGRYFLAKSIDPLGYDAWDRERADYRERYSVSASSYNGYASGYSYGVTDLNYYGNYTYVSGYGNLWRPYGCDIGWDPYMDGAWVWYPGYGYLWVSGYPWGWMPYRYGRWVFVPGYGWMWQPGNEWRRWHPHYAIYHPPSNYHPPAPPPHPWNGGGGGGGGVGPHERVVVIGKGAYTAPVTDPKRMFRDNDGRRPHAPVTTAPPQSTGVSPTGNSGRQLPSAVTPGILPSGHVVDDLRRAHGDNFGMPAQQRVQTNNSSGGVQVNTGGSVSTGGAGGSVGSKPVRTIVQPVAPPMRTVDDRPVQTVTPRVYQQPQPIQMQPQPQQQPHPAPVQAAPTPRPSPPTSSYYYRSGGSGSAGSSSSGSSASGSAANSTRSSGGSSGGSGRSTSSSSSGHQSSSSSRSSSSEHHSSDPK